MSRNTRSGDSFLIAAAASVPLPHSPMISMPGSSRKNRLIRSRAKGSSSTMSVLSFTLLIFYVTRLIFVLLVRNIQDYTNAVIALRRQRELMPIAVQVLQPPPGVRKANPLRDQLRIVIQHAD